ELPCGTAPRAWHFPVRNRVIAALSAGTLVVQATPRSGSLITARHALEIGREVYAIPGRIFDERSLGPHALLRDGARLVQHPQDLLDDLRPGAAPSGPLFAEPAPALPDPPEGLPRKLLALLAPGSFQVPEDLAARAEVPVDQALGALLELELGGWVKRMPGPVYGR
ncbi:MAG TPA: DNA-processing protein DprA, partial [Thermoanaerobaculia bacterium]|nr:DNA-processing protein DprA [Thermoanaerobaculia bacterium]